MHEDSTAFLHMLVFRCDHCGQLLTLSIERAEGNLEAIDSAQFDLKCDCGGRQRPFGAEAIKHWVTAGSDMQFGVNPERPDVSLLM